MDLNKHTRFTIVGDTCCIWQEDKVNPINELISARTVKKSKVTPEQWELLVYFADQCQKSQKAKMN